MKDKIKILVADKINITEIYKYFPKSRFHVELKFGRSVISNKEIIAEYKDYDVLIIRSVRKIDKEFINRANFKIIATCSRGTENIDMDAAFQKGVKIVSTDKGNSISAAEHTIGMIISFYKNFELSSSLIRKNEFNFNDFKRSELCGKTIGIIGFGNIGSYAAKLSKAFGMNVIANDISASVINRNKKKFKFVPIKTLLRNADIVSLHIPGSKENENFIDKNKISLLKNNCLFANTSRGNVVNEDELFEALKAKKIRGACLDVFKNEPFIDKRFLKLNNVLLTNHIAGKTEESSVKMTSEIFKKTLDLLQ